MPDTELPAFIAAAKAHGAADDFLVLLLTRRGWPAGDVYNALADWWHRATGVAVPVRHSTAENARDAFLYLLAYSTLAVWATALGSLWFRLIEHWLPDAVVNPGFYNFRATVTWQIASILIALPIYLFIMRLILRETRANPDRIESGVRKWLTYIALLLAATGVVSDLVCFVDYFLRGEITLRFVLKCATVLLICGSIFWYYLGFLRGKAAGISFVILALGAASAGVYFGLAVTGTPAIQRQIEADNRRVQDLRAIAFAISAMTSLPPSLSDAGAPRPGLRLTDPETGRPYEYARKTAEDYELCANFSTAGETLGNQYGSAFWSHQKGRACFALTKGRPVPW